MRNADQFTVFASQIFDTLYESFPIPTSIPRRQLIDISVCDDEITRLESIKHYNQGILELQHVAPLTEAQKVIVDRNISRSTEKIHVELDKRRKLEKIMIGTIDFLIYEQFIREDDDGNYQLTLKGFTHLNKRFEQSSIQGNTTIIDRLREALRPENFTGSVTTGVFTSLISGTFSG